MEYLLKILKGKSNSEKEEILNKLSEEEQEEFAEWLEEHHGELEQRSDLKEISTNIYALLGTISRQKNDMPVQELAEAIGCVVAKELTSKPLSVKLVDTKEKGYWKKDDFKQDLSIFGGHIPEVALTDGTQKTKVMNSSGTTINPATEETLQASAGMVTEPYDYTSVTYTGINPTTIVYKSGGVGGTTVATITCTYDANNNLLTATKT